MSTAMENGDRALVLRRRFGPRARAGTSVCDTEVRVSSADETKIMRHPQLGAARHFTVNPFPAS